MKQKDKKIYYISNGDVKRYATSSLKQAVIYFRIVRDFEGFAMVYRDEELIFTQYADWYFED